MQLIRVLVHAEILLFSRLGIPDIFVGFRHNPVTGGFAQRVLPVQIFPQSARLFLRLSLRAFQDADSLHAVRNRCSRRFQKGGHHVPKFHQIRAHAARLVRMEGTSGNDDPAGTLVGPALAEQVMIPEKLAVIGYEQNQSVVIELVLDERLQKAADLMIQMGYTGIVAHLHLPDQLRIDRTRVRIENPSLLF